MVKSVSKSNADSDGFVREDSSLRPNEPNRSNDSFSVCRKLINIDKKDVCFELEVNQNGFKNTAIFTRDDVFSQSSNVINFGIPYFSKKTDWINFISSIEENLPISYCHNTLGFYKINEQLVFKADCAIGIESVYFGNFDVFSKGSYDEWHSGMKKCVMQTLPLQFMLLLGLSAVTIGFLGDSVDGSLLVHIYSDSSKGKTTGSALAISTAGNPSSHTKKNSLQLDYGDTYNYRIASLSGNNGVPMVIDEASMISTRDISGFVYACCNGQSKGRLSSDGSQKEVYHWKTCCISNGEGSLLPHCNNNQGIRARLIEIQFDSITESAKQAEEIKEVINNNYGWANKIYAQYIIDNQEEVINVFEQFAETINQEIASNPLASRLSRKLSVIVTTSYCAKKALKLDFDVNGIKDILLNAINNQQDEESLDLCKRVVEFLVTDTVTHKEHYNLKLSNINYDLFPNNCYGFYNNFLKDKTHTEICYFPNQFKKLLEQGGFTNPAVCLKALQKDGYLVVDNDGHIKIKRRINGVTTRVYVVRFPVEIISRQ